MHTVEMERSFGKRTAARIIGALVLFCWMAACAVPAEGNVSGPVTAGMDALDGSGSGIVPVAPPLIRYRVGDGPDWKDRDFKDDDWACADSFTYPNYRSASPGPVAPVWFRFRLELAPERIGRPLVLQACPHQDNLQVFLNGKLVASPQSTDPSTGATPRCIVPLETGNMIALRWIPDIPSPILFMPPDSPKVFSLAMRDYGRALDDFDRDAGLERGYAHHRIVLIVALVVFFLFHLALYVNYPLRRENLYCCVTALLCALALISLHISEIYNYDRAVWLLAYYYCFLAFTPLSLVCGLGLFQLVFAGRFRWTLPLYLVLGLLLYLGALRFGNTVVHVFPVLIIPELVWMTLPKNRVRRLPSGWPTALVMIVMASVMLSAVGSLYGLDSDSGFLRYAPWYLFAVFLEFVSLSFAREYADAQKRIKAFAASLEEKVEERTRELKFPPFFGQWLSKELAA